MNRNKHDSRCRARAKSGKPCRAAATAGGLCFFHANPAKASELGRIGGRSKGHAVASADSLPTVDNAIAVRDTVARLISDVYAGKLQPKIVAGLAPLMNLQLRAIETANLEYRVARLEKRFIGNEKNPSGKKPVQQLTEEKVDEILRQSAPSDATEQST